MLSISLSGMVWTVVNLLVLYLLMKKFLFGPVTAILDQRRREEEQNLSAAEAERAEAEAARDSYEQKLAHAQREAGEIVAQAKTRGEAVYRSALDAARADSATLAEQTRRQLAAEREEMVRGARGEVAALALLAAAKVAGKELDQDADRALVDAFLDKAGETP